MSPGQMKRMADALKTVKVDDKFQTEDGKKHTLGGLVSKARKAGQDLIVIDTIHEYAPVKRKMTGK